ncbi:hypothetical protein ACFV5E_42830 [Streptomyces chartreusis]|uniref:hypothetical protein n=1 Tax=Streptomyces chartreusis TaxID=1969 RepID=UPI00369BE873
MLDRWMYGQGDFTSRATLHERYGGSRLTGISPAAGSGHVFLFDVGSEPGVGWQDDGCYYYAGGPGRGNGSWESNPLNRAIESAWSRGRRLQLLASHAQRERLWRFVDSFMLDGIAGELTLPGRHGTAVRCPLYRLRTIENVTYRPGRLLPPGDPRSVDLRRVERHDLLRRDAAKSPAERVRPETRLSKAFERYVLSQGYAVHRLAIRPTAGSNPMITDTWIAHLNLLIEAKAGRSATDDVRMAIGQLAHYTRHTPGVLRKAILLPGRPERDLMDLARDMNADAIWPDGDEWHTTGAWHRRLGLTHHQTH